ncbi:hypothetical protein CLV84_3998 [Neolewinella xylanilytica]|uniref:Uncharacterized protein n=1 Tax=Neolewinella xylanilytica TaxID=1514080 RepID=A0A2S6I053_9BACT|nr:hypothetical protein [Neolewinella xylanilytica]PPK84229.1 hypothetical protein CLV84_3998 [Neolewinella xylanilytica]
MNYSIIGLLIELALFACGAYLYLYARGIVRPGTGEARQRAETFRRDNATWMRFLGLALAALMLVNVVLHLRELLA